MEQGPLCNPPGRRGAGDNLGRVGLMVLPGGFGKGREKMPASAAVGGIAPARRDTEVPCYVQGGPRWDRGGSAGAACLRCIPRIPSLLPALVGRGGGCVRGCVCCQPLPPRSALEGGHVCVGH